MSSIKLTSKDEIAVETFRGDLEKIKSAVQSLRTCGMREKTVLILLSHYTGLSQKNVKKMLVGFEEAVDYYFGEDE